MNRDRCIITVVLAGTNACPNASDSDIKKLNWQEPTRGPCRRRALPMHAAFAR